LKCWMFLFEGCRLLFFSPVNFSKFLVTKPWIWIRISI
jgi:hypothetical protein